MSSVVTSAVTIVPQLRSLARERGFTLIELLVSLSILAVILGLLAGALRVISQNWEVNAERIETLDMVARAADILRRDTAGLQRVVALSARTPRYLFTGRADQLSFVTLEPPYPSAAGPYYVSYAVVANGPELELVRARAPYRQGLLAFPGATPANQVRLLQGPYRYRFAYAEKGPGGGRWLQSWPLASRLPDLIRLEILDARRDMAVSPPLVVSVRADAELTCLAEAGPICSAKSNGALKAEGEPQQEDRASKYRK